MSKKCSNFAAWNRVRVSTCTLLNKLENHNNDKENF